MNAAKNIRLTSIMGIATALLLLPLIAMQFSNGVDWSLFDFVTAGVLLYGTGLTCELVMRKFRSIEQRLIICGAVLFVLFLIWAELAVGIFGSPLAGS